MAKKLPARHEGLPTAAKAGAVEATGPTGDVAFVFGKDEHGMHILRRRSGDAPIEAGVIRPLRSGKPIEGEVISLSPRGDAPLLFDVKSELPSPFPAERSSDGPAQVASDAYRKGWDAMFGRRRGDRSIN